MSRRKTKSAITYMLTLFLALVLVGGTGFYILTHYVLDDEERPVYSEEENTPLYVPPEGLEQTTLFVLDGTGDEKLFMLLRFMPIEKKLVLVPITSRMLSQVNTTYTTVGEFYRTGGIISALPAIENASGIKIEKYMVFDNYSFSALCDILGGGVTCNVPENITFLNEKTGEQTIIMSGVQLLDGNQLRKYLTYPDLNGGEDMRIKLMATLICDMINQSQTDSLATGLDSYYKKLVNQVQTDITSMDFEYRRDAIEYIIEPTTTPAGFKIPSGEWQEDGTFKPDEAFKTNIKNWFNLNEN